MMVAKTFGEVVAAKRKRQVAAMKGRLRKIVSGETVSLEVLQENGIGRDEGEHEVSVQAMAELGYAWDGDTFTKR